MEEMSDLAIKVKEFVTKKLKQECTTKSKQNKLLALNDDNLFKGMKIVKTFHPRFPYRFIKGNYDYTPMKIKDKKAQEFKIPIDMTDFASFFFSQKFLPSKFPIFFYDETSTMVTGLLTGYKYRYGAIPLEHLLQNYSKEKIDEKLPQKGMVVEMEPLKERETLVETFQVFLEETETFNLFSRVSSYVDPEEEPFIFYVKSPIGGNDIYHSVIKSKETDVVADTNEQDIPDDTNKKLEPVFFQSSYDNTACVMTPFTFEKAVDSEKCEFKSQSISVSPSDIYDSRAMFDVDEEKNKSIKVFHTNVNLRKRPTSVLDSPQFEYVYNTIERILDAHYYQKAQILFEHVHLIQDANVNHSLSPLITFQFPKNVGLKKVYEVTSLSWHPLNKNLIGVAYGKMHLEKKAKGLICIWNLKNPTFPERAYKFQVPIKCIAFSDQYLSALAIGFADGHVATINFLSKTLDIISDTSKLLSDYMAITHLEWFQSEDGDHYPVSSNEAGEIYIYNIKRDFVPELLLDFQKNVEPVKGVKQFTKHFSGNENKMLLKLPISTFTQHPKDKLFYLVGTFDGCIHICNLNYKTRTVDVFSAHEGPITNIEFHPEIKQFFLTSGCDYFIRVWCCKIFQPLVTFSARQQFLHGAKWCITNPLLIIGLSEMYIDVWDLRRINNTIPVATYENVERISYLTFNMSPFGQNLMVGDANGTVMLFAIAETESEPFFRPQIFFKGLSDHIKCRDPSLWARLLEVMPECEVEVHKELFDILEG
ncbi:uncharacterized protein [Rhodnius prolixus]|uniref:Dynein axonemal intermediate chain 4 n=1 Tax=Rhodnius prolixus TaxID=13249 RepID=T1HAE1_RHOPR